MAIKRYITTPIYYVNDNPHIGHAYSTIVADVLARYHREKGYEVYFQTGTDEHGEKIEKSAAEKGMDLQKFVDENAKKFEDYWKKLNISFDNFIRTTDPHHKKAVKETLNILYEKGYIYKGNYDAIYCVGCEQYLTKSELEKGKCLLHKKEPEKRSSEAYLFKLSEFQKPLLEKIKSGEFKIEPESRKNEMVKFIEGGLEDISISRLKDQCSWGVELPFDENHTLYVWVDAFLNYITGLGWPNNKEKFEKFWPADVQLMAKDILRVHATLWASLLLALDLPLPKKLFVTGFLLSGGEKMSKSLGNVIDPLNIVEKYGNDTLRHFLLAEVPLGQDGDVTEERIKERYTSDLANGLGNLVQRVAVMIDRYFDGEIPQGHSEVDIDPFERHIESLDLHKAVEYIWSELRGLDQYIEEEKPWALAKNNKDKLSEVLGNLAVSIVEINKAISPLLPETAEKISTIFKDGKVNVSKPLFPRK